MDVVTQILYWVWGFFVGFLCGVYFYHKKFEVRATALAEKVALHDALVKLCAEQAKEIERLGEDLGERDDEESYRERMAEMDEAKREAYD